MNNFKLLSFIFGLVFLHSCSNDILPSRNGNSSSVIDKGILTGKIYAQNGTQVIGGARIFTFDDFNTLYETTSDAQGNFVLNAPVGDRIIYIQTGNGDNFRNQFVASVQKNKTVAIDPVKTKLVQVAKMAYVKGSYDKIEDIIAGLGYNITPIAYNDLKNMNIVDDYDIIFLNCGSRISSNSQTTSPNSDTVIYDNLSTFVSNGGSLYASDWDVAYLVGGEANTTSCGPLGGFIPDTKLCVKNIGSMGTLSNTNITNANLATAMGFTSLDIQYDLGAWEKVQTYDPTFWDLMVATSSGEALMLKTNKYHNPNAPKLPVGNGNNSGFITICHNPSGNNPITLSIPSTAWPAHQGHGDTLGSCTGNSTAGNIYFTTFHNHASGNIGNAGLILQYVILNL